MEDFELTEAETLLARAVEEARTCEFEAPAEKDARPTTIIRGAVIRKLLLGLPVKLCDEPQARFVQVHATGLHLFHAMVEGLIDLRNGRGPSSEPLPPLYLNHCTLPDVIDVSHAHISYLSFSHSKLSHLIGNGVCVEGHLDINWVSSSQLDCSTTGMDGKGLCWAEFRGAHIRGHLDTSGSKFVCMPNVINTQILPDWYGFALDLHRSKIDGSAFLTSGMICIGGVDLSLAHIGGDVLLPGAVLKAGDGCALDLSSAHVGGDVSLSKLRIKGLKAVGESDGSPKGGEREAEQYKPGDGLIFCFDANIKGSLYANWALIDELHLFGAKIGNYLVLNLLAVVAPVVEQPWTKRLTAYFSGTLRRRVSQSVDLRHAKVHLLADDNGKGIPDTTKLDLEGFEFETFFNEALPEEHSFRDFGLLVSLLLGCAVVSLIGWSKFLFDVFHVMMPQWGAAILHSRWLLFVAWAPAVVMILRYGLSSTTSSLSALRIRWLNLQYTGRFSWQNKNDYSPGPYEQLVRVFRAQGFFKEARQIAMHRLCIERQLKTSLFARPISYLYSATFGYGLSSFRALMTFAVCIVIGAAAVGIANGNFKSNTPPGYLGLVRPLVSYLPAVKPTLVVNSTAVNAVVVTNEQTKETVPGTARGSSQNATTEEVMCGNQIEPLLYALDVFVPALDLQQESRCAVSTREDARWWRMAKALYSVLGWIVVSLTILTVSGVLRRQAEA